MRCARWRKNTCGWRGPPQTQESAASSSTTRWSTRNSPSKQNGCARLQKQWRAQTGSAKMISSEEMSSHDLADDDASSTLRVTADLFEKSAAAANDKDRREALLDYAKLYREMAELSDRSHAEADDEQLM